MNTLQFIDAMTGRLAWPLAAVVLGLTFHRPLAGLIDRIKRLKWGEKEAELTELAAAAGDVQEAIQEVTEPLTEGQDEREPVQLEPLERLVQQATNLGFSLGRRADMSEPPHLHIEWEDGQPALKISDEALRRFGNARVGSATHTARSGMRASGQAKPPPGTGDQQQR